MYASIFIQPRKPSINEITNSRERNSRPVA